MNDSLSARAWSAGIRRPLAMAILLEWGAEPPGCVAVANHFGTTKQSADRALRDLRAAGLVNRPHDQRSTARATEDAAVILADDQSGAESSAQVTGVNPTDDQSPESSAQMTADTPPHLISCNTPRPLKGAYPPPGGAPPSPPPDPDQSGDARLETPANRLRRRYLDAFEELTGLPGHTATLKARSAVREFDTTVAKLMSAGVTEDELAAAIDLFCADDRSRDESLPFRWLVNDLGSKWLARVRNPRSNANQPDDGFTTEWGRQAGVADLIIPSAGELPF